MIPRSHHLENDEIAHIAENNLEGRDQLIAPCAFCRDRIRTALKGKNDRRAEKLEAWAQKYEAGKEVALKRGKQIDVAGRISAAQWVIKIGRELNEAHAKTEEILRKFQKSMTDYREAMGEEELPEWAARVKKHLDQMQELENLMFFLECKTGMRKLVGNHPNVSESEGSADAGAQAATVTNAETQVAA